MKEDKINIIIKRFDMSVSNLAYILGVTRMDIYKWLEGEDIPNEYLNHINKLYDIGDIDIPRIDAMLNRKLFNGDSLLDILKKGSDIDKYLSIVKEIADKEKNNRSVRKGLGKSIRPLEEVMEDI